MLSIQMIALKRFDVKIILSLFFTFINFKIFKKSLSIRKLQNVQYFTIFSAFV